MSERLLVLSRELELPVSDFPRDREAHVLTRPQPEETVHPAARLFYENEVFKTGIFIDQYVFAQSWGPRCR